MTGVQSELWSEKLISYKIFELNIEDIWKWYAKYLWNPWPTAEVLTKAMYDTAWIQDCKTTSVNLSDTVSLILVSAVEFSKKKSPPKFDDQGKGTFQSDNSILPSMVLYSHFQISVLFTVFFYVVAIRTYQNNIFCFNNWTFCTLTLIYIDILFRCWSRIFTDYVLPQPIKEKTPNAKKVFFQFLAR